jgi:type IV pilus assembly protein PilC
MGTIEKIKELLHKDLFQKTELSLKNKQLLFANMHVLMRSGIDIINALELSKSSFKKSKETLMIDKIIYHITEGASIYKAFQKTKMFDNYETYCIKVGEETGQLKKVFINISTYYKKKIEQKKKFISALSYPILVLATTILVMLFMVHFVIPMFGEIFKRFGSDLPSLTKKVVAFSSFFKSTFLYFVGGIIILYFINKFFFSKRDSYQRYKSKVILRIPIWKNIVKKNQLSKLCMTFELMLDAKVPLAQTIDFAYDIIDFYPIKKSMNYVGEELIKGKSFHEGMSECKIYDKRMLTLIQISEESNSLATMFKQLREQYDEEVDEKIKQLRAAIEPVMLLLIGSFVTLILIAMYLPIFKMGSSFGGG